VGRLSLWCAARCPCIRWPFTLPGAPRRQWAQDRSLGEAGTRGGAASDAAGCAAANQWHAACQKDATASRRSAGASARAWSCNWLICRWVRA
jgi:hypothetical protein